LTPRAAATTAAPGTTPAASTAASAASAARPAATTAAASAAPTAAADASLVGAYYSPDLDVTWHVVRRADGGLALAAPGRAPVPLVATAAGAYRSGGTAVRFERAEGSAGAAPSAMVLQVSRIGEMRLAPVRPSSP
jgi:hypothetical protein